MGVATSVPRRTVTPRDHERRSEQGDYRHHLNCPRAAMSRTGQTSAVRFLNAPRKLKSAVANSEKCGAAAFAAASSQATVPSRSRFTATNSAGPREDAIGPGEPKQLPAATQGAGQGAASLQPRLDQVDALNSDRQRRMSARCQPTKTPDNHAGYRRFQRVGNTGFEPVTSAV